MADEALATIQGKMRCGDSVIEDLGEGASSWHHVS